MAERSTEGFAQSLAEEGAVSADVYLSRLENTVMTLELAAKMGLDHSRITYMPIPGEVGPTERGRLARKAYGESTSVRGRESGRDHFIMA